MFRRLRHALRMIHYYSAARPRTVWDRLATAALLAALALALPATWLTDLLVARVEPVELVTGSMSRITGTSEYFVEILTEDGSVAAEPDPLATTPYAAFTLRLTDATRGWPFATTIQRTSPTLILDVHAEAADRTFHRADADSPIVAALDTALLLAGKEQMLAGWLNHEPTPPQRRWHAWLANYFIWLVALTLVLTLLVQLARFIAWSLDTRSRYQQHRRNRRNLCPSCAYDLRGLDFGERCPECGTLLS